MDVFFDVKMMFFSGMAILWCLRVAGRCILLCLRGSGMQFFVGLCSEHGRCGSAFAGVCESEMALVDIVLCWE